MTDKSNRRWWQFSIKSLIILMFLVAVIVMWMNDRYQASTNRARALQYLMQAEMERARSEEQKKAAEQEAARLKWELEAAKAELQSLRSKLGSVDE